MVETANPKVMAALENKIAKLADEKLLLTDKLSKAAIRTAHWTKLSNYCEITQQSIGIYAKTDRYL